MKNIGSDIAKHHKIRYDFEIISDFIKPKSKVLDIGCADGELLEFLKKKKNIDGRGLELSQFLVSKALEKGLSVVQGDAENDLSFYPDHSFDYAILSQTIQATKDPKKILKEMLRIAKFAIVSMPNFAYFRNRFHILFKGRMPVSESIPFQWYDTPNIHFCSIKDFEDLCSKLHFSIKEKVFLTKDRSLNKFLDHSFMPNFFAEYGVFLVSSDCLAGTHQECLSFVKDIAKSFKTITSPQPTCRT